MPVKAGKQTENATNAGGDNKQKDAFYKYKDIVYSRISTRRQQLHKIAYEEAEEKRRQLILHRIQWRSTIKGQRLAQLDRQLDEFLLRDADSILQKQSNLTTFKNKDSKLCDWSFILSELDYVKKENGVPIVSNVNDIPPEIGSAAKMRGSVTRQSSNSKQLSSYIHSRRLPMTKSFVDKFCDGQGSEMAISTNNTILSRILLSHNYVRHNSSSSISLVDGEKGSSYMLDALNDLSHYEIEDMIPKPTLVDSIFLVGPVGDDIVDISHAYANDPAAEKVVTDFVEPKMIYTAGTEPDAELEILPFFCFPNWISAVCAYSDAPQQPTTSRTFVFQLTAVDGFIQFAVCLLLSRRFKVNVGGDDEKIVYCTTDYCVCAVTRTPFINYIQYILLQCDRLGWLLNDVNSPLPIYDQVPRFSMHNSLRMLDELNTRLKKIIIPQLRNYTILSDDEDDDDEVKPIEFWLPWRLSDVSLQSQKRVNFVLHRNVQERFYRIINMTENDSDNHSKMTRTIDDSMVADRETIFNVLLWSLPTLLRHLPLHQIVLVLGCILAEMRIIIHSQDLSVVSGVLLALVHLLRPLKWAGPIIVTLPPSLNTFLESPVPLILGMRNLPACYKAEAGMIVIDPSHHTVDLHPTDVVVSHTLTLPNASALVSALRAPAEAILRLSKRFEVSDVSSSEDDKILPVPTELNIQGQKGQQLLLAIATFANTMETHILSIVNTAVQDSWDQRFQDRKSTSPKSSSPPHNFEGDMQNNIPLRTQQSEYDFLDGSEQVLEGEDLPPVEQNAPRLSTNPGKQKSSKQFITRLQNTQMFSNYCRFASVEYKKRMSLMTSGKSKSTTAGSGKDSGGAVDELAASPIAVPFESEKTVFPAEVLAPSDSSPAIVTPRKRSSSIKSETLDPANDPLVILFSIMLTGTIPNLGKSALQSQDMVNLLWCNGRCDGMANTPRCTSICLKLWEGRALIARRNEEVKKISAKLLKEKVPPKRHPNETESQFNQRLAMTQQFTKKEHEEIMQKHRIRKSRIKYYKRKLYLKFMKEYKCLNESAIVIQSLHRAFSVRKDIPALVYSLRERKGKRYQAAVAIQNFVRKTLFKGCSGINVKSYNSAFGGKAPFYVKKFFPEVEGNDVLSGSPLHIRHEELGSRYRHTQTAAKNLSDKAKEILKTFVSIQDQRHSPRAGNRRKSISPQTVSLDEKIKNPSEYRDKAIREQGSVITTGTHESAQAIRRISMTSNSAITITEGSLVASDIHDDPKNMLSVLVEDSNTLEISPEIEKVNPPKQVGFMLPGETTSVSHEETPTEDLDEPDFSALLDDNAISRDENRFAPIDNLGPGAKDAFTPQQRAIVVEMWTLLSRGIQVLKHAKSGRPHKRYLFCNKLMTKFYWRVNLEDQEESVKLQNGVHFEAGNQSYGGRHDPPPREKRKTILSAFQRVDADRELFLDQIVEVRDDISTDVMRRSYAKQFMNRKASSCIISIVLHDRSLDFEVEERFWGPIFHALQIIVNYYREIPATIESTDVVMGQRKL